MLGLYQHRVAQQQEQSYSVQLVDGRGSILDSGSSRHIHPEAVVTDCDHSISLHGFDHPQQWTNCSGYLPVQWVSRETEASIAHDIDTVDHLDGLMHPILSMEKLIRDGFLTSTWEIMVITCIPLLLEALT